MAGPASLEGKKICFAAMYIIAENEKHTAFLQNEAFAESACAGGAVEAAGRLPRRAAAGASDAAPPTAISDGRPTLRASTLRAPTLPPPPPSSARAAQCCC